MTENDQGYDYAAVIGEMADLVALMSDQPWAGTVREPYDTIGLTLPENAGEDRILLAMSSLDERHDPAALARSYGPLGWNLSQMPGRKDLTG